MRLFRPSSTKALSMKRRLLTNQTACQGLPYNSFLSTGRYAAESSRFHVCRSIDSVRFFSSSSDTKSSSKKKKRSRRSNLQRSQTPKQLSYKGSSPDNKAKITTKHRRKSKKQNHKHQRNSINTTKEHDKSQSRNNNERVQSSIASSIVDKWEENSDRDRLWEREEGDSSNDSDDESFSSLRSRQNRSSATFQLDRFLEKQQEFCESLDDYRLFWYPASEKQDDQHQEDDWKKAMDFHHPNPEENFPWLDLSYEKLVESEHLFRRVCSCHHDLFVSCASYLTDLSDHHHYNLSERNYSDSDEWTTQDLLRAECEDLLGDILPSWERLRRERALLVEAYQPSEQDQDNSENNATIATNHNSHTHDVNTSDDVSYENNQWVGWLKGMLSSNDHAEDDSSEDPFTEKVTAHLNPECAPNHYHYSKLVGRLYFHYLPLERHNRSNPFHLFSKSEREGDDYKQALASWEEKRIEILGNRAEQMQYIVDQSLHPLIPNRNNGGTSANKPQHHNHEDDEDYNDSSDRVLTDKIVRLLIRSYLDIETLSAAQKAERVYHRHPNHRKRLLWYVTMCYLKVITTNKKELARSAAFAAANHSRTSEEEQLAQKELFLQRNKECASAAKRICELVSSKHAKEAREFQHCSTIAFEALAILPQYGRRGLKGYYDRVHSLGILKFGPKVWEALLNGDESNQPDPTTGTVNSNRSGSRRRKRKSNRKSSLEASSADSSTPSEKSKPSIDLSQSLHSKDHRILNYLIQIYSHEEKDLQRALRLLEVSLDLYSPHDLKESLDQSIFHKLLRKLSEQRRKTFIEQQKKHRKSPTSSKSSANEFGIALGLVDNMISEESWFPTEETFRILFSMIPYCDNPGRAAEKLRFKLEACRFLSTRDRNRTNEIGPESRYLLNPLEASTLSLRAWLQSLQQYGGNLFEAEGTPSQRALAILKTMKIGSSSLFSENADGTGGPTAALYSLALEVCSRDIASPKSTIDVALEIFEFLQNDGLLLEESTCMDLLQILADFSNNSTSIEDQHDLLQARARATKRVCEALTDQDPNYGQQIPSILEFLEKQASYLQLRHPEVYDEHLAELGLLDTMKVQKG